ncbi:unnamed protein product [Ixodes pacificus]
MCKQCPKAVVDCNCLPHHTEVHMHNDPLKCQPCAGTFFNWSCMKTHVPLRGSRNLQSVAANTSSRTRPRPGRGQRARAGGGVPTEFFARL